MVRYQAIHSIEDCNRTYHIVLGGFGRGLSACCVGALSSCPPALEPPVLRTPIL